MRALTQYFFDRLIGGKVNLNGDRVGTLCAFLGDSSYGPSTSAVRDRRQLPGGLRLLQNYPNPFASATDVTFSVADAALHGAEVTLKLYDALGRACATLYRGSADGYQYTIRMDASRLPPGTYVCVLRCGGTEKSVTMEVVR